MREKKKERTSGKRLLAGLLALLLMFTGIPLYGMEVQAASFGDYEYTVSNRKITITGYNGSGGNIEIPAEIDGNAVTAIDIYAFRSCSSITSIIIPEGVISIGNGAFRDCSSLTSVTIPKGVTTIGDSTFYGCSGLTSIIIPEGVTSIGSSAFSGCSSLTSVTIPKSVTTISRSIFENCSGLTSVTIPEGVTTIDYETFRGCSSLVSITIPKSVATIGSNAFFGCRGLTSVAIPEGVTSIGSSAFNGCRSLTSATIPKSVTTIGDSTFSGCSNLASITIPEGVTVIDRNAFSGCRSLTSVTIPKSVTTIGDSAFRGCSNLVGITIPEGVTVINRNAFYGCSSLASITIPEGVTRIDSNTFSGCSSLAGIAIPESVTRIDTNAFSDCSSLTGVTIPKSVTTIGSSAFSGCSGLAGIKVENGNPAYDSRNDCNAIIKTSSNTLISGCKNTTIPEGVTSIDADAFSGCSGLTGITIPEGVTAIGRNAFSGCSGLAGMTIPEGVTSIGTDAFSGCSEKFIIYGEAGTAAETYAKGNGIAFQTISDKITPKTDISKAVVTLAKTSYTYDGKAKKPSVTVKLDGKTLILNTDYIVFYSNNTNVGTAKVTVTGQGSYTGSAEKTFTISKAVDVPKTDISKAAVTLAKTSYTYDGKAKKPSVTVKLDGKTLVLNTDYTVSYSNNTNVGTAKVTVTGKGSHTGSMQKTFTITKAKQNISCKKKTYNVAYGAKPFSLKASANGSLTYKSSDSKVASVDKKGKVTIKGTGIATITVKAKKTNNYKEGSIKITVKVSPKKQTVKTVKADKGRKLVVKWAADKKATGYEVQVSVNKNFKKIAKSKKTSKNTYTFTKLTAEKKYYVRVRSYKKSGKNTLYGAWSRPKQSGKIKR